MALIEAQKHIKILSLGLTAYEEAWALQKSLQKKRIAGDVADTIILCQHPTVITLGRSAQKSNVLYSASRLKESNIEYYEVERGGDVTLHSPGQLVAYPILDLSRYRKDVAWYMRSLEKAVLQTLATFDIHAEQIEKETGVWCTRPVASSNFTKRKIASIGVRISRWCTMHGVALNITNDVKEFASINPCGFTDIEITSVQKELRYKGRSLESNNPDLFARAEEEFVEQFAAVFEVEIID